MEVLKRIDEDDINDFWQEHLNNKNYEWFVLYIDDLIEKKKIARKDLLLKAGIPSKYGYKLLTGRVHTTSRDRILRICFAMELSLTEAQRPLRLYGFCPLYPKNKRDCIFIIALNKEIYDIGKINERLLKYDLEPLEKE